MKIEPITVRDAAERGRSLPYALIRSLSRVTLGPTPDEIDFDELIEARFFDSEQEVRIFRGEMGFQAARLTAEDGDITIERAHDLANPIFGETVTVCSVLDFDEDGQAHIAHTRLAGWKGGD